jgi:hypothetical protein
MMTENFNGVPFYCSYSRLSSSIAIMSYMRGYIAAPMFFVSWLVCFKFQYLSIIDFKLLVICTHNFENYFNFIESMLSISLSFFIFDCSLCYILQIKSLPLNKPEIRT